MGKENRVENGNFKTTVGEKEKVFGYSDTELYNWMCSL